jgi:hypothetical protein
MLGILIKRVLHSSPRFSRHQRFLIAFELDSACSKESSVSGQLLRFWKDVQEETVHTFPKSTPQAHNPQPSP